MSGHDTPDGAVPGRWWTPYFNSNADMHVCASQRGVPAQPGETTLEIADGVLTATTSADGTPVIRTKARAARVRRPRRTVTARRRVGSGMPIRHDGRDRSRTA
jgi:hypothetical protein